MIISNLSQRLCTWSPPVLPGGPLRSSSSTCRSTPSSLGVAALPPRHRQPPIINLQINPTTTHFKASSLSLLPFLCLISIAPLLCNSKVLHHLRPFSETSEVTHTNLAHNNNLSHPPWLRKCIALQCPLKPSSRS